MDDDDFKCSICLEIFKSPIRMTHCGHVYCEECLLNVSKGEQGWNCPECRTLNNCAVNSLPRNYHLEKLVEKFKLKKEVEPESTEHIDHFNLRQRQEEEDRKYAQQLEEEERAIEETRRQEELFRQQQETERLRRFSKKLEFDFSKNF